MHAGVHHKIRRPVALKRVLQFAHARGDPAEREGLQPFHAANLFHRTRSDRKLVSGHGEQDYALLWLGRRGPRRGPLLAELGMRRRNCTLLLHTAPTLAAPKMNRTRFSTAR